ncbi:hypothetical protein [Azonexus sp.]|uniref:hypothetical protein n=1 Tax=Azonexus sp. TaxID=1872668 RepID=UPI0039E6EA52
MRRLLTVLTFAALPVLPALAEEAELRSSASLIFKYPELLQAGTCVMYREGGAGWVMVEPVYYLKARVVSAAVSTRPMTHCPQVPGKLPEQYSRAEAVRVFAASPCLPAELPERNAQIGLVSLRVESWETPYERKMENAGRLYRGFFLDQRLKKDLEIELEASLLAPCPPEN